MHCAEQQIRDQIQQHGPVSFARFMSLALYSPDCGYYETHARTIGRSGDYFTSVSVGPVFGQILGIQCEEWLRQLPGGQKCVVEVGAHDGKLAADVLLSLSERGVQVGRDLQYIILESSQARRAWQQKNLERWADAVTWIQNPSERRGLQGICLSNEFFDALPVHVLRWNRALRCWEEWGVTLEKENFCWCRLEVPSVDPVQTLRASGFDLQEALLEVLPDGFVLEVVPAAAEWISSLAAMFQEARFLTIDYGASASELMIPERTNGTLRAYAQHKMQSNVLEQPGQQDITAHLNFTGLEIAGQACGLQTESFSRQGDFLTRCVSRALERGVQFDWSPSQRRQFQTLVHPAHLGHSFRVLVQRKGANSETPIPSHG